MTRNILLLLTLAFVSAASCGLFSVKADGRSTPPIRPGNFSAYDVELEPYEFRIYFISNHTEPLAVSNEGWWHDSVVYQVYPRSFMDSDGNGHGDLPGLTSRLDYITNLGCDAIWTLPLFQAFHDGGVGRALGYEATNYYGINTVYGTMKDFTDYRDAAHARGVKVIMDMVINHAGKDIEFFRKAEANDPRYVDWFIWTNANITDLKKAGWGFPWGGKDADKVWHYNEKRKMLNYATWGCEFNFKNPAVQNEFLNVARFWLTNGADGYRLDAIRYLIEEGPNPQQADTPSTLAFMREYQAVLTRTKSNAYTVGEVWTDDRKVGLYYQDGLGLNTCFSFDFQSAVRQSLSSKNANGVRYYIRNAGKAAPRHYYSPFLDNHDIKRLMVDIGNDQDRLRLGLSVLLTFTGTPYLYAGIEYGNNGQYTPMAWDNTPGAGFTTNKPWLAHAPFKDGRNAAAQMNEPGSTWNVTRDLIRLRKSYKALTRGDIRLVKSDNSDVLCYIRPGPDGTVIYLANFGDYTAGAALDFTPAQLTASNTYLPVMLYRGNAR